MPVDYSLQEYWRNCPRETVGIKGKKHSLTALDFSLISINEETAEFEAREELSSGKASLKSRAMERLGFINPQNSFYNVAMACQCVVNENFALAKHYLMAAPDPLQDGETSMLFLVALNGFCLSGIMGVENFQANLDRACRLHPSDPELIKYVFFAYRNQFGDFEKAMDLAMKLRDLTGDKGYARKLLEEISFEYS